MKNKCIVWDLDGTICNVSHRQCFVASKPRNWNAWNNGILADIPNQPVRILFNSIKISYPDIKMFLVTGRSDDQRDKTVEWLKKYWIVYDQLYMRKEGDYRDDSIVKSEIADEIEKTHQIMFVFDDRPRVVKMWHSRNIWVFNCQQGYNDF